MPELEPLLDEFMAYWWRVNPTAATRAGIHTHDGELERYDPATILEIRDRSGAYLRAFERIAPADDTELIDLELVRREIRRQLYEFTESRTYQRNPLLYLEAPLTALYLMAVRGYSPAEERARSATRRLLALPASLDQARSNLTQVHYTSAIAGAKMARGGLTLLHGILPLNLGSALEDDPAEFARWENALRTAEEALTSFADWLEGGPGSGTDHGFAVGRGAYEEEIRIAHGLSYTVDELIAYGNELKVEIEARLEEVAGEVDPALNWRGVIESIAADHPSADKLISAYTGEVAYTRNLVEDRGLLEIPASESLEVSATPEFLRPIIPYLAYLQPAPFEVDQRGFLFVTVPGGPGEDSLHDHPWPGIRVTAFHEAYPGHHLQTTISNRAPTAPMRAFRAPAFAEGWALYSEELAWEEGFYSDPRERLLQLRGLLWRACEIIVDIGLHTQGWGIDEGVTYLTREVGLRESRALSEVERFIVEPTSSIMGAIGLRELWSIRDRWREVHGPNTPIRDFHDQLLRWGTIPLPLAAGLMVP